MALQTPARSAFNMTAPPEVYRKRRAALAGAIRRPMILFAGQPRARHYATNTHPFRAGSSYLYFGGPPVAGAAVFVEPGSDGVQGCALVRPVMGFDDKVWIGDTPADDALAEAIGLPETSLIAPDQLAGKLTGRKAAYVAPPCPPTTDWVGALGLEPAEPQELLAIIDLRLIKDEHEIKAMREAARVGVEAHRAAMKATRPGATEAHIFAEYMRVLYADGCVPSFSPIVTTHGEVLHTDVYPGTLEAGRMLLVDAGAEEPGGYASDITRTLPVSGKFTPIQRHLHDTVYRAEREAIAACVPGARFRDLHDLAAKVICEGLVAAELLRGDPAQLAAAGVHTLFFPHGLGHLIGLDVHDMEDFGDLAGYANGRSRRPEFGSKFLRLDRDLEPGMTVTIEPGFYIVPAIWENEDLVAPFSHSLNRPAIDALVKQAFGGIRIEETVHVTESEPEVLSASLPADADAVEAIAAGG